MGKPKREFDQEAMDRIAKRVLAYRPDKRKKKKKEEKKKQEREDVQEKPPK